MIDRRDAYTEYSGCMYPARLQIRPSPTSNVHHRFYPRSGPVENTNRCALNAVRGRISKIGYGAPDLLSRGFTTESKHVRAHVM